MKDTGRIFLGVFVKDVQSCQVKVHMCCKELSFLSKPVEGLLLYTSLFNLFISMGSQEL